MKVLVYILWTISILSAVNGYKILFLAPVNGKSHWIYLQTFIEALLDRGHEVTCITAKPYSGPKSSNYTEVLMEKPLDINTVMKDSEIFDSGHSSPFVLLPILPWFGKTSTSIGLNDSKVQEFIHRNDLHFDLVINEEIYHDSWLMFGYKYKAPIVTICPTGIFDFFDRNMGLLTPYSHVGHTMVTYTDNMTFSERFYNTILSISDWILRRWVHIPAQNEVAKQYFGHLGSLPSIDEIIKNVSLIFANAHRSIFPPRPSMPTLISIGGAHVKKPKPLPNDLKKFLDESEHGVIYFSLGTIVQSSKMPKEQLNAFLDSFKQLKQRILWKYEDESSTNIPSNVMVRKWLPQNDILAHPNVVLFISHGGMFSNFEAVANGVQMLMIPFIGDQFRNAIKVEKAGYGKFLNFKDVTTDSLKATLDEMLTQNKYSNRAKEISAIFNDNPLHPMDEAMWWIEYVCRHKGAKHLKSHAINMSWFSYLLVDVLLVTIIGISTVLYISYVLIKKVWQYRQSIRKSNKKTN